MSINNCIYTFNKKYNSDVTFSYLPRYINKMTLERFKTTVIPLREMLLRIAGSMLKNESEAEDAVQEAFLRLWNVRTQLSDHPNVQGFSVQTLKNICIDKLRSEKTKVSLDNLHICENSVDPYVHTEQSDSVQTIRNIIDTLPELQRRIILMRDVEGYELEEIAQITATEATAVRVNLSRARKKVRDKYISIQQAIKKEYERY